MTAWIEIPPEQRLRKLASFERETEKTLITRHPSLKEVEIALAIYESFRLDQIAASQETPTAP